jgi:hypothetical protein
MTVVQRLFRDAAPDMRFSFTQRRLPANADDRLSYRIPLILSALAVCRQQTSSFQRLVLMTYTVRTPRLQARLERFVSGRARPDEFIVRYESSLVRMLAICRSLELIKTSTSGASFTLAESGRVLYGTIAEQGLFVQERFFFGAIARQLSEAQVTAIMRGNSG